MRDEVLYEDFKTLIFITRHSYDIHGEFCPITAQQQEVIKMGNVEIEVLEGDWIGGFEIVERYLPIKVHFKTEGDMEATIDIPMQKVICHALTQVGFDTPHVHFEMPRGRWTIIFDGKIEDDIISGEVKQAGTEGTFQLHSIVRVDPKIIDEYLGIYQLETDDFITIYRPGLGGLPTYFQYKSGRVGAMYPMSETTFFSGTSYLVPLPMNLKITFIKDHKGKVTGLVWSEKSQTDRPATKIKLREEDISFQNGDVTLHGTMVMPNTEGPHPTVVMVHGSGPSSRDFYLKFAYNFACHGIATLAYDKRGVGASTGDWRKSGFHDLAQDALASIQLLKGRRDINPKQIGLLGISQGGWLTPLAASLSKDVAFIIPIVGAAVTPTQQEQMRVELYMRADGFPEDDIEEAVSGMKMTHNFASTGEGWDELIAGFHKVKHKKWFLDYGGGEPTKDNWFWAFWRLIHDYDPISVLEKVTCPVLAIFGELDLNVRQEINIPLWEEALKKSGNKDYTIKVFQKANHGILEADTGGKWEIPRLKRHVPRYFETIINWILERVHVAK